jgi:hypothetical protein
MYGGSGGTIRDKYRIVAYRCGMSGSEGIGDKLLASKHGKKLVRLLAILLQFQYYTIGT